jgi:hypothetical protein
MTLFPLPFPTTFLMHWLGKGETKVGIFASLAVGLWLNSWGCNPAKAPLDAYSRWLGNPPKETEASGLYTPMEPG